MHRSRVLIAAAVALHLWSCSGTTESPRAVQGTAAGAAASAPTADELELYEQILAYRRAHGLPVVPLSRSLSQVARLHAADLQRNGFGQKCNIHSWSEGGAWNACCYRPDHSHPHCMWNKPRELTAYKGLGFEIAYWTSGVVRPPTVINVWKRSPVHEAVLLNEGRWRGETWKSLGVGIEREYAVVWLGLEDDPAGYWKEP